MNQIVQNVDCQRTLFAPIQTSRHNYTAYINFLFIENEKKCIHNVSQYSKKYLNYDYWEFHMIDGGHCVFLRSHALFWAAQTNHVSMVKFAKSVGINIGRFCFLAASARHGSHLVFKELFQDPGFGYLGQEHMTPLLHLAMHFGHAEIVEILLQSGVNVNQVSDEGCYGWDQAFPKKNQLSLLGIQLPWPMCWPGRGRTNTLTYAIRRGHPEVIKVLLQYGADANVMDVEMHYPVEVAVEEQNAEILQLLFDYEAKVDVLPKGGLNQVSAAIENRQTAVVKMFLERGVCARRSGGILSGLIETAIVEDLPDVVTMLLDQGTNPKKMFGGRSWLLGTAARCQRRACVEILLGRGVRPDLLFGMGVTPLTEACLSGDLPIMKLLVEAGADASRVDLLGRSYLDVLMEGKGDWQCAAYVIEKGGLDVMKKHAITEQTVLYKAAMTEHAMMLSGVNVDVVDWCGRTPLFMAAQAGSTESVSVVLSNGADVAAKDRWGGTAFFDAVRNDRQEVVRQMFAHVKQLSHLLDHKDAFGKTAMDWAIDTGLDEMKGLLETQTSVSRHAGRGEKTRHDGDEQNITKCDICTRRLPSGTYWKCEPSDTVVFRVCFPCTELSTTLNVPAKLDISTGTWEHYGRDSDTSYRGGNVWRRSGRNN